ncbi:hypothetical protein MATL_G00236870 [Megalops atlanticus]|uniref:Uncharacterized protein n=1 Tax=Megalops atlanticus TaxID=7932 RepID=A0A9D3SUT6_MEGAT|nr:hypothetical protein MATL_G00236870 [Megalops atlanticus]
MLQMCIHLIDCTVKVECCAVCILRLHFSSVKGWQLRCHFRQHSLHVEYYCRCLTTKALLSNNWGTSVVSEKGTKEPPPERRSLHHAAVKAAHHPPPPHGDEAQ